MRFTNRTLSTLRITVKIDGIPVYSQNLRDAALSMLAEGTRDVVFDIRSRPCPAPDEPNEGEDE